MLRNNNAYIASLKEKHIPYIWINKSNLKTVHKSQNRKGDTWTISFTFYTYIF